jgi:hypothetical protein
MPSAPVYPHTQTFTRELLNRHDPPARAAVKELLTQIGYAVVNEDEAYGSHDLIVSRNGAEKKVEVEQKMGWKTLHFPFKTHDVSCRKKTSNADMFFQTNSNCSVIAYCPMSEVKAAEVYRKNTCLGSINEPFFAVPVAKMKYYYYEDGAWMEDVTSDNE